MRFKNEMLVRFSNDSDIKKEGMCDISAETARKNR